MDLMKALSEYFPWYDSSGQGKKKKKKVIESSAIEDIPSTETAQSNRNINCICTQDKQLRILFIIQNTCNGFC